MKKFECACGNDCEPIPYPQGQRWLCGACGSEWFDYDASIWKEKQKKQLHELLERLAKKETEP